MFKNNGQKIKSGLFLTSVVLISLSLTSCGNNYFVELKSSKNAKVIISKTLPTSGEVIKPENITLTNTLPEMAKNKTYPYYLISQNTYSIDVLVLPINFKDSSNFLFKDEIKAKINAAFNGSDKQKVYPTSVKDFYMNSSFGKINLNFEVADWYSTFSSKELLTQENLDQLIVNATKNAKINGQKIDLNKFDKNKDGVIDALWAVYDVPNYANNPTNKNNIFWAYTVSKSLNSKHNNQNIEPLIYSFASYDFMDGYYGAINARTFIHETGHLFGLSDLYDYGNSYFPTAGFDMMDFNLFDHNSYSKMCLGWIKPYIVYGNATINEEELIKSNSCVVILEDEKELNYKEKGNYIFNPFQEYILIDYFDVSDSSLNYFDLVNESEQKGIMQIDIDESGYRLYHVDGRLLKLKMDNKVINAEFYNENIPISKAEVGMKLITNSSKKAELSESKVIEKLGYNYLLQDNNNIDYFNEITLLANNFNKLNQDYTNLYYSFKEESRDEKVRTPLTNEMLFHSGDSFKINEIYSKYFVNGKSDEGLKFNDNNNIFSTSIYFE